MMRLVQRGITRTALPHPWFDPEHMMLKADPQIMRMLKHKDRIGALKKVTEIDQSFDECNADQTPLYELTREDYLVDPALMTMFTKLYSNFNPKKILEETETLLSFDFNQKLQKLSEFDLNYTNQEMENIKNIDARYVISRFCPPKFKSLIDVVLKKLPIYGEVVPMEESEKYYELSAALDKQIYIFFFGEGAFFDADERYHYRRAILKQVATEKYLDGREIPFVTEAEDNFLSGVINWPGSDDHEYRTLYRPYFREYDIDKEYWQIEPERLIVKIGQKIWSRSVFE